LDTQELQLGSSSTSATGADLLFSGRAGGARAMSNVIVEIRAAEGGEEAKSIAREQLAIYARLASRRGL
jgi:protein subunit release factor A